MNILHFDVTGMHCGGCVKRVISTLQPLPGVRAVDVDLSADSVTVGGEFPDGADALMLALTAAGYPAVMALGAPTEPKKSGGCCG